MNDDYLGELTELLRQASPNLAITHKLKFKNVFGAVGGYVDGHIFISCGKFGVALRLPPEIIERIFKEIGVKHLKYFPSGHIKKEYAVLPKRILMNRRQLRRLIEESVKNSLSV